MNLIIAIVVVIAGQRYLGIGDWIWWLFGIIIFSAIVQFKLSKNWE